MKSLREFINMIDSTEQTNEGEFGGSDRNPEGKSAYDRNTLMQNLKRGVRDIIRAPQPVGKYTDVYGTEGYTFLPDWNALGYAQYGDQKIQKIDGTWISDDGDSFTWDKGVINKIEQQALADMVKSNITPRGGWKENNPAHAAALNQETAPTKASATRTPVDGTTSVDKAGKPIIYQRGKWWYVK